jgi:hypothetical protein
MIRVLLIYETLSCNTYYVMRDDLWFYRILYSVDDYLITINYNHAISNFIFTFVHIVPLLKSKLCLVIDSVRIFICKMRNTIILQTKIIQRERAIYKQYDSFYHVPFVSSLFVILLYFSFCK